ncbi:hypothetical protein MTO96_016690 [Rhipicephalus appendiculatus]
MCEKKFEGKTVTESAKCSSMGSINHSKHLLANYTRDISHKPLFTSEDSGLLLPLYFSLCHPKRDRDHVTNIQCTVGEHVLNHQPSCLKTSCSCKIGLPHAPSSFHVFCLFKCSLGFCTRLNAQK